MLHFLGRLHLIFLHFPIGLLVVACVFGAWGHWKADTRHRDAVYYSLFLGALAATLSAGFGWMLAQDGGYEALLLQRHQWLGFATAGLAWVAWFLRENRLFLPFLSLTTVVMILAGHFGGTLTHGENYLTNPPSTSKAAAANLQQQGDSATIESRAQAILTEKCVKCHNPAKKKGALLLDSPEGIRKGGKHGPCVVAGNPDSSRIIQRILLPVHEEAHMPPKGRQQLTPDEIAVLKDWVLKGPW